MYNYFQLHPSKNFWRPLLQTMSLPRPSVTMEEEERMLGGDGNKVLIGLFIGWRYDQYSDWRYREKRQHSSGGCCVLHGATGFPCCRPQGAGHNLKQVLLFVVYFKDFSFFRFSWPTPHRRSHLCPYPSRSTVRSLTQAMDTFPATGALLKNHPKKSDFTNGIEWMGEMGTDRF